MSSPEYHLLRLKEWVLRLKMAYQPCGDWLKIEEFLNSPFARGLTERERLLIVSNGSLTRLLEALYLKEIKIELKGQTIGRLSHENPFGLKGGEEVIEREVWIIGGGKRLVFAHSIIPIKGIPPPILDRIVHGSEPLGAILEEEGVFCRKNHWEFGRVEWKDMAYELNLPHNHIFLARRYKIITRGGIMAVILEVFSPCLLEEGCIV